jgi:3alpha(or 20beta)-hydroxysteroid dehydrogenase
MSADPWDLSGRVALITGAARGQGAAAARVFHAHGARIVIADLLDEPGERLADELGRQATYVHLDVRKPNEWTAAIEVARSLGPLGVLVNNAGVVCPASLTTMTVEHFLDVAMVNQVGTLLGIQSAIEPMREAGGGSIINISSVNGLQGKNGLGAYTASKFAIRGLTRVAAAELGALNIRVNSVLPGIIDTAIGDVSVADDAHDDRFDRQPIARIGVADEVANVLLFLASDASSYCTGADFVVDGGMMAGSVVPGLPSAAWKEGPHPSHG